MCVCVRCLLQQCEEVLVALALFKMGLKDSYYYCCAPRLFVLLLAERVALALIVGDYRFFSKPVFAKPQQPVTSSFQGPEAQRASDQFGFQRAGFVVLCGLCREPFWKRCNLNWHMMRHLNAHMAPWICLSAVYCSSARC